MKEMETTGLEDDITASPNSFSPVTRRRMTREKRKVMERMMKGRTWCELIENKEMAEGLQTLQQFLALNEKDSEDKNQKGKVTKYLQSYEPSLPFSEIDEGCESGGSSETASVQEYSDYIFGDKHFVDIGLQVVFMLIFVFE